MAKTKEKPHKKGQWKKILNIITLLALAGLVYAVRDQLGDTLRNLRNVNIYLVALIIPLQAVYYYATGKLYQGLFRVLGERFRTRSMIRLGLELNFVNAVFPSVGVSGFSYMSLRLKSETISTAQAALAQLMRFILIFVAFQILLIAGLVLLAFGGKANDVILLISGVLTTLMVVGSILLAYIIGSKRRINIFFGFVTRAINRIVFIFHTDPEVIDIERARKSFGELHENYMRIRRNLGVMKRPLAFALLLSIVEIASIFVVYLAFGQMVNIGAIILAYAIANFAGVISVLPGGAGAYEFLMTTVMAAGGVSPALSLPVTVMYRVVSMGVQLPPGYFFYQKYLRTHNKMQAQIEAMKTEHDE